VDDFIISIADQLKHGIDKIIDESPELRIGIAGINELAGMQAAACSDHVASRSYLTYALTLLPTDHWKSHYDLSLRFSLRLAKSCYSCGDVGRAQRILQEVTEQSHSIEDKIPAYALLARSKSRTTVKIVSKSHLPNCFC
jgi:predicted ATPase